VGLKEGQLRVCCQEGDSIDRRAGRRTFLGQGRKGSYKRVIEQSGRDPSDRGALFGAKHKIRGSFNGDLVLLWSYCNKPRVDQYEVRWLGLKPPLGGVFLEGRRKANGNGIISAGKLGD